MIDEGWSPAASSIIDHRSSFPCASRDLGVVGPGVDPAGRLTALRGAAAARGGAGPERLAGGRAAERQPLRAHGHQQRRLLADAALPARAALHGGDGAGGRDHGAVHAHAAVPAVPAGAVPLGALLLHTAARLLPHGAGGGDGAHARAADGALSFYLPGGQLRLGGGRRGDLRRLWLPRGDAGDGRGDGVGGAAGAVGWPLDSRENAGGTPRRG